jgi:hypothetical protein
MLDASTMVPWATFIPSFFQIDIDQPKQVITEIVAFHPVTEVTDGCLVGNRLQAQVNAREGPHGAGMLQGLFCTRIG